MKCYFEYKLHVLIVTAMIQVAIAVPPNDIAEDDSKRFLKIIHPMFQNVLAELVRGFVGNPAINNQVLSLNLTNMLILLAIKGILWGAAYFGSKDGWTNSYFKDGRKSDDDNQFVSETDILFLLNYLKANQHGHFECLYRAVCENPGRAEQYLRAIKLIGNSIIGDRNDAVLSDYEKTLQNLEHAVLLGNGRASCQQEYPCKNGITNFYSNDETAK